MVIVEKDILLLLTAPSETMVVLCRHKLNNHGGEPRHIAKEIEKAYTPPPRKGSRVRPTVALATFSRNGTEKKERKHLSSSSRMISSPLFFYQGKGQPSPL